MKRRPHGRPDTRPDTCYSKISPFDSTVWGWHASCIRQASANATNPMSIRDTSAQDRPVQTAPATVASYTLTALGVTLDPQGTVTALTDNSPALVAGLAKGDRILAINGTPPDLAAYELTAPALLLLEAPGGATRHIRLDPWHAPEGVRPVGGANVLDPDVVVF